MADKRDKVHPELLRRVDLVLEYMASLGKPMKIAQGFRSAEYQASLYAQGRTKPGKIVTRADGYKNKSNHQAKADGYGHAVDLCFVDDPRTPKDETWDEPTWQEWAPKMWAKARELGLACGADWPNPDRPHLELPEKFTA